MIRFRLISLLVGFFIVLAAESHAGQEDDLRLIDSLVQASQAQKGRNKVETLIQLSEAYRAVSFDKSLMTGETAIALSENEGYLSLKGKTLKSLGVSAYFMGDYDLAQQYFDKGLKAFSMAADRKGIAECLHNLALVHELKGEAAKAMDFYNQSLEIEIELGDADGQATTILNIGNLFYEQGKFAQAYDHYYRALLIRQDIHDTLGRAELLKNMAMVYWQWDDVDKAIANLNEAGDIFTRFGNEWELSSVFLNLGMIYSEELNDSKTGRKHLLRALSMKQELGDIAATARIMGNLGNIYSRMKDLTTAFDYFENALRMYEQSGHALGQVEIWFYRGRALFETGQFARAAQALEHCLSLSANFNLTLLNNDCHQLLMKAYALTGDNKAFNKYFSLFMEGYDSSMKNLNKMSVQEARSAYLIDNLINDINQSELENKHLYRQLLRYKMILSASLALTLLAVVTIVLLIRHRKRTFNAVADQGVE